MEESFDLFGDKIAIIHAKDFLVKDGELKQIAPGEGIINYKLLCELIKERKPYIELLMEETSPSILTKSVTYIEKYFD